MDRRLNARVICCRRHRPVRQQEDAMAKGKDKGNKEKKKPKADKNAPKSGGSSYQQSKGGKK